MKIFITGASGYIGSSLAKYFSDIGYKVRGLIRQKQKFKALQAINVTPILGNLDDTELLTKEAHYADIVINAANSDHLLSIQTFIHALKNSNKLFIHTSNSSIISDDARGEYGNKKIYTDEMSFTPIDIRLKPVDINNAVCIAGVLDGFKTAIILPTMVYGETLGLPAVSNQLQRLFNQSRRYKAGAYIGKGLNEWSNVHILDLVKLYHLVIQKKPSASYFYAENGSSTFLAIAQSISHSLGYKGKIQSWPIEEAIKKYGNWAQFALGSNSIVKAVHAKELLNWKPQFNSIHKWIKTTKIQ